MTWNTETLTTEDDVFNCLAQLRGEMWYCRGQSKHYCSQKPLIDRDTRKGLPRLEKITRERRSIDIFRASARFFSHPGEMGALIDDFLALAVLRHYRVPTRLLDWSRSPYVAAYFAVRSHELEDGEIWSFDEAEYMKRGVLQWKNSENWQNEFARAAFDISDTVPDFLVCMSYKLGFARQNAQDGLYSVASRFDCDHADRIESLLGNPSSHTRYILPKTLKPALRDRLRQHHGIWDGSLYPDSAGAAETARAVFC